MGYDRSARKTRVNMTLNADLVRQARDLTGNLSDTVETLLAAFVDEGVAKNQQRERDIDQHIQLSNKFVATYGSLANEFSTL